MLRCVFTRLMVVGVKRNSFLVAKKQFNNKAIIIGGGPCGCAASLALQKKGIECEIFERIAPNQVKNVGAAIGLHGGGICLRYLGFGREWQELKNPIQTVKYITNEGKTIGFGPGVQHPEFGMIARDDLYQSLMNWCIKTDGITYNIDKELINYEQNKSNNTVTAYFKDGTQSTGNMLIGADGVNSKVRQIMLGDESNKTCKKYSGFSFYYLTGSLNDISEHVNSLNIPKDNQEFIFEINNEQTCMMTYIPLITSKLYVLILFYENENVIDSDWAIDKSVAELLNKINEYKFYYDYKYLIEKSIRINHLSSHVIQLKGIKDSWNDNRVVLIGDSAHATTPFGGQGANQAIYDGIQLAHLLGENNKILTEYGNDEINDIFKQLYDIRNPVASKKVVQSMKAGDILMGKQKYKQIIRNLIFKIIATKKGQEKMKQAMWKPDINFKLFPMEQ